MKYIKKFENENNPQVGDYVILYDKSFEISNKYDTYSNFINNNIGQIIRIQNNIFIDVMYENIPPKEILKYFKIKYTKGSDFNYFLSAYNVYNIKHISKNKEDLQYIVDIKKYNI